MPGSISEIYQHHQCEREEQNVKEQKNHADSSRRAKRHRAAQAIASVSQAIRAALGRGCDSSPSAPSMTLWSCSARTST
jgi:hypothetical protein